MIFFIKMTVTRGNVVTTKNQHMQIFTAEDLYFEKQTVPVFVFLNLLVTYWQ